jgi:hypothetical protein
MNFCAYAFFSLSSFFGDVMGVDRAEEGKTPKDNLLCSDNRVST